MEILAAAAFAVRSTVYSTLQKSPGQLIFGRDMMLNITHEANWELIRQQKQAKINKNNELENAKKTPHVYNKGDKVMVRKHKAILQLGVKIIVASTATRTTTTHTAARHTHSLSLPRAKGLHKGL